MTYIRVKWIHNFPDEPVLLYSELDDQRFEVRKVEMFPDGSIGYADRHLSCSVNDTQLGSEPVPAVEKIAKDPEFEAIEIDRDEFESVWNTAIR